MNPQYSAFGINGDYLTYFPLRMLCLLSLFSFIGTNTHETETPMATKAMTSPEISVPYVMQEPVKRGALRIAICMGNHVFSPSQWEFLLSLIPVSKYVLVP